jgi:hypothetical protein
MAKICLRCGKKLGFLAYQSKEGLCTSCEQESRKIVGQQIQQADQEIEAIAARRAINDQQYALLKNLGSADQNRVYASLVDRFLADGELDSTERELLTTLFEKLTLDPSTSTFVDRVLPSLYVGSIREEDTLPIIPREPIQNMNVIMKKGETPHYLCSSTLKEPRIVKTGFVAGSQGVSLRVMKGVTYRVGGTRGHFTKEEQLVETSQGTLILTNQRLYLHPNGGRKPANIPLSKILSYQCFDDAVTVYKEGREKPFVFTVKRPGESETIGICLGFLCMNN